MQIAHTQTGILFCFVFVFNAAAEPHPPPLPQGFFKILEKAESLLNPNTVNRTT